MLSAPLRILNVAVVIGLAACSFGSTPLGQSSNKSSASKGRDGGAGMDATTPVKRRVAASKADARTENDKDLDAGVQQDPDEDKNKDTSKRDAGDNDRKPVGGSSGSGRKPSEKDEDKQTDTDAHQHKEQTKPLDAGMTTAPQADAGPGARDASTDDAGNPIGDLEDLAKNSPPGRTTETINKFLMALGMGDAPASSIKEFLTSIDDEVNCKMNPLAYECITACRAVGVTCALCVLEDECRTTMLDICGVTALLGCR